MRMVVALLEPTRLDRVRAALQALQVTRMTVCDPHAYARPGGDGVAQRTMVEIAVNDELVERTVQVLEAAVGDDGSADGRVFVLPVAEAVGLAPPRRGPEAV